MGLLAASAFFTFGASLGLTAGWGTKVAALTTKLGLKGKLANILGGAITHAGTGAWAGGIIGAASDRGFMSGAGTGAAVGAAAGGAIGAFQPVAGAAAGGPASPAGTDGGSIAGAGTPTAGTASTPIPGPGGMHSSVPAGLAAARPSAFERVMSGVIGSGGIGPIIQGIGAGILQGSSGRTQEDEAKRRRDSYDIDYDPLKPIFYRAGNRILGRSFEEQ